MSIAGLSSWFATPARLWRLYARTFIHVRRTGQRAFELTNSRRSLLAAAALVTLAGAGLRAFFLNHPMRYDESWIFFSYMGYPLHDLVTRYEWVGNHMLHTILEHEAIRFGGDSAPVLRLPAVIAGTAMIPLAVALAYTLTRRYPYAVLAGGLVAVSSVLVDYSTNARGYTMVCAFTLGACLCTLGLIRDPTRRRLWPAWAVLGVLGTFTIPTMVFPMVALAVLLALDALLARRRRRRVQLVRLGITVGSWALLTLLLYLPALVRMGLTQMIAAHDAVQRYADGYFPSSAGVARLTLQDWARDATIPTLLCVGIGLALGFGRALRRRSLSWFMPWVMLAVGVALATLLPMRPYPRVWLYLLPVMLTFAAAGLALVRPRQLRWLVFVATCLGVLVGGYRVSQNEFLVVEDRHTLVDAELVAEACADWPAREFGLIMLPGTQAVRYYAHRWHLPRPAHPIDPRVRATYVVVNWTQSLEDVLAAKGKTWVREYGPPRLYRTLPHSRIYRMDRIAASGQVAGVIERAAAGTQNR